MYHKQRVYPACLIFTQVEVFKDQTEMFSLQLSQKVNSVNQHLLVWEQMRQFYIRKSQTIRIIWPILDSIFWFLLLSKESPKWILTETNIKREEFNMKKFGNMATCCFKAIKVKQTVRTFCWGWIYYGRQKIFEKIGL